jgi:sulfatase maturation enzyme AslB (radical SAM superfamily)
MERYITIVDYHQRINNQHNIFDKNVKTLHKCMIPWQHIVINMHGDTYICMSPAWLPKNIGSLLDYDNFYDLLNTHEARSIRSEISLGRYSYCNNRICGHLSKDYHDAKPTGKFEFLTDYTQDSKVDELPIEICFDFDYTCNFKCPSCRIEMVNHNQGPNYIINKKLVEKIKDVVLKEYVNRPVTFRWAGGEPFISKAYLDIWKHIIKLGNTNIQNIIQTNGSYLLRRSSLLHKFLPYIQEIRVSFDAGTANTYKNIRINGKWDTLLKNCYFINDIRKNHNLKLTSNFVVQLDNYIEIPKYIEIAESIGFDSIQLNKMWNWGTWDDNEFKRLNITDLDHPNHKDLLSIIESCKSSKVEVFV